jgi:hypothetical protein
MRHELRHAEQFAKHEIVYRIGLMTTIEDPTRSVQSS